MSGAETLDPKSTNRKLSANHFWTRRLLGTSSLFWSCIHFTLHYIRIRSASVMSICIDSTYVCVGVCARVSVVAMLLVFTLVST